MAQDTGGGALPFRDLLAENFGMLIAYVVPGLAALWAVSLWDPGIRAWVSAASALDSTIGGFLVLILSALGAGMVVQALRFVVFEQLLPSSRRARTRWPFLRAPKYSHAARKDPEVRAALREITDQHYRYYQCHGGLACALLIVFGAWCWKDPTLWLQKAGFGVAVLALEAALVSAALDALKRTRERAAEIQPPLREAA